MPARDYAISRGFATGRGQRNNPGTGGGGTPPVDPAPTIVDGPILFARTTASITVEFTSDQYVKAYMEYGFTTGYGSESAHENSFSYKTHRQTVSNLQANTTYHFKIHIENANGQTYASDDFTFSTLANPSPPIPDFDVGMTYTDVAWPTGVGWTSGALSTIRQNIQNLINQHGSGSSPTNHKRHILPAGVEYPVDVGLMLDNLQYVTFEGSGTEGASEPWGQTGGATISIITNTAGSSVRLSLFNGGNGAGVRYNGIRWHGLRLKGSAVNMASSTAGSQASEKQHGIRGDGATNCLIDHCVFIDFMGDNVYLSESLGSNGVSSGVNCNGWEMRYNQFLAVGRQGLAPGQGADNVWIHHNYFADPAYCYIDTEGNYAYQVNSNFTIDDNVFGGKWCWMTTGGPEGLGYAAPAIFFTNFRSGGYFNGYIRIRRNRVDGIENSPYYTATVPKFVVKPPWNDFQLRGEVTIEDNIKTSAKRSGPIVILDRAVNGPILVRNNLNWKTATGNWVQANNAAVVNQSGNT